MSLYETISSDVKTAMKAGDKLRVEVLRFTLAPLNAALKEKQTKDPTATLTDDETSAILQKEAKRRKESIDAFQKGGRQDLVDKEISEFAFIAGYLPAQMSREEIEKVIDSIIGGGTGEFATVMREASKVTKGKADGKLVAEIAKEKTG